MEVQQPERSKFQPPDPDPMVHPKVMTQVLSQMIPLRTMYDVTNVYRILSTYSSWRFFRWVPDGEEIIVGGSEEAAHMLGGLRVSDQRKEVTTEESQHITPHKTRPDTAWSRKSPPMSPCPCRDSDQADEEEDEEKNEDYICTTKGGTRYASAVVSDGPKALRILAWVLGEMESSPRKCVPAHERDFLYVVKKEDALGGYESLEHSPDFYKGRMPRTDVGKLYTLEELGHRFRGGGNLCVIKVFCKG